MLITNADEINQEALGLCPQLGSYYPSPRLLPRQYGHRVLNEVTGTNGGPIKTEPREQFPELKELSDEDLLTLREILLRAAGPERKNEGEEGANGLRLRRAPR
jgi:hypothetical protein